MVFKCIKHNDLRLENILVRDNGTVVLIDFGNVKSYTVKEFIIIATNF